MAVPKAKPSSNQTIPSFASSRITPNNFSQFGTVIQNPATHDELNDDGTWRLEHQIANQGSATKWLDVTHLENWYERAKSKKPAKVAVNMFVCKPRTLRDGRLFDVRILERHPFTSQTFVPLGLKKDEDTRYLVIVAPTLPLSKESSDGGNRRDPAYPVPEVKKKRSLKERLLGARPNLFTNDYTSSTTPSVKSSGEQIWRWPKGRGGPDLNHLQTFIVRGDQAVTYGPGTWHAPMVVLGEKQIDFVVMQFANGVGEEDCQEVQICEHGLSVDVEAGAREEEGNGVGYVRAKL